MQIVQRTEYLPTAGARRLFNSFMRSLPPPDLRAAERGPAIVVYMIMQVHNKRCVLQQIVFLTTPAGAYGQISVTSTGWFKRRALTDNDQKLERYSRLVSEVRNDADMSNSTT